jgi:hypothetical protein
MRVKLRMMLRFEVGTKGARRGPFGYAQGRRRPLQRRGEIGLPV